MNSSRMAFSFVVLALPIWLASFATHFSNTDVAALDVEIVVAADKICQGEGIVLEAVVSGGAAPFTYEWYDNEELSGSPIGTASTLSVQPSISTNYSVRVESATDSGQASTLVAVKPAPTIKIIERDCRPDPGVETYFVKLRSISDTLLFFPERDYVIRREGGFDYVIEGIPSGDSLTIIAQFFSTGCSKELKVGFDCDNDCPDDLPPLTVDVTADKTKVCNDEEVILTATPSGSFPPYEIEWYDQPELEGEPIGTGETLTITPGRTTKYYAIVRTCEFAVDSIEIRIPVPPSLKFLDVGCEPCSGPDTYFFEFIAFADSLIILPERDYTITRTEGFQYRVEGIPSGESISVFALANSGCKASLDTTFTCPPSGCPTGVDPTTVEIQKSKERICIGETVTLIANPQGGVPPYSYRWSVNGQEISTAASVIVTPTEATTYQLEVESVCDCATTSETVETDPVPDINIISKDCELPDQLTYCVTLTTDGDSLNAGPGDWPITQNQDTFIICGIPVGQTVKIRAAFSGTGCFQEVEEILEDCEPIPCPEEILVVVEDTLICLGGTAQLTAVATGATGPYTYEWYDNPDLSGDVLGMEAILAVSPSEATTYFVKTSFACPDTSLMAIDSAQVTVKLPPELVLLDTFCEIDQPTFCVRVQTNGEMVMTLPVPYPVSFIEEGVFEICGVPSDSTVSIVSVILGCEEAKTVLEITKSCPIPPECPEVVEIINTQPAEVCIGDAIQLEAEASGGTPPYTYRWFDNAALSGEPIGSGSSITVSPDVETTYYVQANNEEADCTDPPVDSITVLVNARPTLTLLGAECEEGDETYCVAVFTNGTLTDLPAGATIEDNGGGLLTVCKIPISLDTLVLKAIFQSTACESQILIPRPECCFISVEIGNADVEICREECVDLVALASGPNAPFTYEWYDNAELSGTPIGTGATIEVCPEETTTYFVVANDEDTAECTTSEPAIDSVTITVKPSPILIIGSVVCNPQTLMVEVNFTSNTPLLTASSGNITSLGGDQYVLVAAPGGTVTITATIAGSDCAVTATIPLPGPEECICSLAVDIADVDSELCEGECLDLVALPSGTNPPFSFEWYDNPGFAGSPLGIDSILQVCPAITTTYYVVVNDEDTAECQTSEPAIDSVTITVNPKPTITIDSVICNRETQLAEVYFTSDADVLEASSGTITDLGEGKYVLMAAPGGSVTITGSFDGSDCSVTATANLPDPEACVCALSVNIEDVDSDLCVGECADLLAVPSGSNPPFSFEWYDNPEFSGDPLGNSEILQVCPTETTTYYVVVNDADTPDCITEDAAVDSIVITVNPLPTLDSLELACNSESPQGVEITFVSNADTLKPIDQITALGGQRYSLTVIPGNSVTISAAFEGSDCTIDTTISIPAEFCTDPCLQSDLQVTASFMGDIPDCISNENPSVEVGLMATITGGVQPVESILWFNNPEGSGDAISQQLSFTTTISETTTFFVFVNDSQECSSAGSVTIDLNKAPDLAIDGFTCGIDSLSYTVQGTTNALEVDANGTIIPVDELGAFTVADIPSNEVLVLTVTDPATQCTNTIEVNPEEQCCVPQSVGLATVRTNRDCIIRGDTTQLFVENCPGCTYSWGPVGQLDQPNSASPIATITSTTEFQVTITDPTGCSSITKSVEVIATECGAENIFLPTAFTPNNDGRNDILTLQVINVSNVELLIYSRWGEEIVAFNWTLGPGQSADRGDDGEKPRKLEIWDGTFKGRQQPPSVFGYYLKATCVNAGTPVMHEQRGNVTLLR